MPKNILIHQTTVKKTSYLCPKLKKTNGKRSPHGAVAHFSRDTIINSHRAIWQNFIFGDMKKLLLMTVLGFLGMTGAAAQHENGGMIAGVKNLPAKQFSVSSDLRASEGMYWNLAGAAEEYAGGTGTEADPYQIATVEQLMKLCLDAAKSADTASEDYPDLLKGVYFKQTADIDLSGAYSNNIVIGNQAFFCGHYDGNGYAIKGYKVFLKNPIVAPSAAYMYGLFMRTYQATIKNVVMQDASMDLIFSNLENNQLEYSLLACIVENSTIENCKVSADINVIANGKSTVQLFVDALAFSVDNSTIRNCHTEGSMDIEMNIASDSEKPSIYNTSLAAPIAYQVMAGSKIINCTNKMNITNKAKANSAQGLATRVSGLVNQMNDVEIVACSNTGALSVSGDCDAGEELNNVLAGGLVAYSEKGNLTSCWSACEFEVLANGQPAEYKGLIADADDYFALNCFYDAELAGLEVSTDIPGAVGTEHMQSEEFVAQINTITKENALLWEYVEGSYPILGTRTAGETPTATESIAKREISFRTVPGAVVITAPEATQFAAYTFTGATQATQLIPAGTTTVNLPAGLYILKIGEETHKVNVK